MSISKFDRASLKTLQAELQTVLDAYAAKNNIEFAIGGIRFSEAEATIKLTAKVKGATTRADANLMLMIKALKLVEEKNGRRLVRYDAKKYKFPFIYEENGKMFKTSEERARQLFAA